MGILKMKWCEAEMLCELQPLLQAGEQLTAAVYCTYQDYGFLFTSKRVIAGYIGVTDINRLIGVRYGIFLHETVNINLNRAAVHISEMPLGAVHVRISDDGARLGRQRFTFNARTGGEHFPDHEAYAAKLLQTLRAFAR